MAVVNNEVVDGEEVSAHDGKGDGGQDEREGECVGADGDSD